MLYSEVFNYFNSKQCHLLTDKEEYILLTKTKKIPKLRYIASCSHENEVHFNVFKSRNTGVICPLCRTKENKEKQLGNASKTEIGQSIRQNNEEKCIDYFIEIIKIQYKYKKTSEGCLSDLIIKPINQMNDLWLKIQVKTTLKCLKGYSFNNSRRCFYKDCLIICICWEDKKMWLFNGNDMTLSKISIGYNKSKYFDNEINKENIFQNLKTYYNKIKLSSYEDANEPICLNGKKEMEFKKLRIQHVKCNFTDVSNYLHYDFIINDKKVQEKVGTKCKNSNKIFFSLCKRNGSINGVSKFKPYGIGENNLYWLHLPNKKHFYLLPEKELINNDNNTIKKSLIVLVDTNDSPINNETNNKINDFLFNYDNINYEFFNKLI